ncbi:hypothetical protein ABIB25_005846 [Nakamurella sp. UYEF19]
MEITVETGSVVLISKEDYDWPSMTGSRPSVLAGRAMDDLPDQVALPDIFCPSTFERRQVDDDGLLRAARYHDDGLDIRIVVLLAMRGVGRDEDVVTGCR